MNHPTSNPPNTDHKQSPETDHRVSASATSEQGDHAGHNSEVMHPAPFCLRGAARGITQGFHHFFHRPAPLRLCAILRIAISLLTLINLVVNARLLELFYSERGILPADISQQISQPGMFSLLWWLPTQTAAMCCYGLLLVCTVGMLLGCCYRLCAIASFVLIVWFQVRNLLILDGEDAVARLLHFYLIFLPADYYFTWRSLTGRSEKATLLPANEHPSGWALRLIQLQLCLIFFMTGVQKCQGSTWLDGTALFYVARLDDYFGKFPAPEWLFDQPISVAVLTWSTLALELFVPIFIWFKQTRLMCLLLAIGFHLATDYLMFLFLFPWYMIAGWMSFAILPEVAAPDRDRGATES